MLMCACSVTSIVSNSATPWTVACQDSLSLGYSQQEYWNGLPCPPPGDLPSPGIEPVSLKSPALVVGSLPLASLGSPQRPLNLLPNGSVV